MPTPPDPKIYHITHLDNLPQIVDGVLWSDAERIGRGLDCTVVGMSEIKRRRLEELEIHCHPGTTVGQYVPFYFCPRSVMLYLLHRGNSPGLTYQGGQGPILHLEADLVAAVDWATASGRRWAFSKGNAGAYYTRFFSQFDRLDVLDWDSISAADWRDPDVKEAKQSEFLLENNFPWHLVERIGVIDNQAAQLVSALVDRANHRPRVEVVRKWYY